MLVLALLALAAFAEVAPVRHMKEGHDRHGHRPFHPRHHPHFHGDKDTEKVHHFDMSKFRDIARSEHPENARFHQDNKFVRPFEKEELDPALKNRHFEKPIRRMDRNKNKVHSSQLETVLYPNTTYTVGFSYMTHFFNVPYAEGDSIAVHIVRTSEKYSTKKTPVLTRCVMTPGKKGRICENDKKGDSLSFVVTADELRKNWFNSFEFSMFTTTYDSGVNVGLYVCVGENATLETCGTPSALDCVNGVPSQVMNVCICNKNFTGLNCEEKATGNSDAPSWNWSWTWDSEMDAFFDVFDAIACVISFISFVITFVIILLSIAACCAFLRACCMQYRQQRGRVVRNNNSRLPPPPAYQYHPLNVVPPPPPPPPPMPGQCYDVRNGNAIEMSTLPVARNANPIYVMPPLAPVKQVPVYVQPPPAPKN